MSDTTDVLNLNKLVLALIDLLTQSLAIYHVCYHATSEHKRQVHGDVPKAAAAAAAAAAAKSLQSCPTLCDPIDSLLPGSSVPGILQARTLEWVATSFFNA